MLFGTLANASVGNLVRFPGSVNGHVFKVVNVRDTRTRPLLKDTLRRRPENIRSIINATIINVKTGKIQTRYFAENVKAEIIEV
jgi:hypothetical protein